MRAKVWSVRGGCLQQIRAKGQGLRAKGKSRAWFWDLMVWDLMHRMEWAQQRPKLRTWECGYGENFAGDIVAGTASSGECIQYYIGFVQNTYCQERGLRIVRVLPRRSYSTKEGTGLDEGSSQN